MADPIKVEELRDLGFGSVVSRESRSQLLNPDGSFNVERNGLGFWSSLNLYQWFLTIGWGAFFLLVITYYAIVNLLCATCYWLCGPSALDGPRLEVAHGEFLRDFFFSIETFATIGYGHVSPHSLGANIIMSVEALTGLLSLALVTGILFARFSRPTAKFIHSRTMVVAPYGTMTSLQFRLVNGRRSQILDLQAKVIFTRFEEKNGRRMRQYHQLTLERGSVMFLPLAWTVVHPIDEHSPLKGLTAQDLKADEAEFLVLLTGLDETFSQMVQTRFSYPFDQVIWNAKFGNVFVRTDGRIAIDVTRLHDTEVVGTVPT
jgi:inward rectifier potassium channel